MEASSISPQPPSNGACPKQFDNSPNCNGSKISNHSASRKGSNTPRKRRYPLFMIFLGCSFVAAGFCYLTTYLMTSSKQANHEMSYRELVAQFAGRESSRNDQFWQALDSKVIKVLKSVQDMKATLKEPSVSPDDLQNADENDEDEQNSADDSQWPTIPPPLPDSPFDDAEYATTDLIVNARNRTHHSQNKNGTLSATQHIPYHLWFTDKTNILKTKEPQHFYENVIKTIDMYTHAFEQNTTDSNSTNAVTASIRVTCMDNDYCVKIIQHVSPGLVPFFLSEARGDYKADICRLAALYLHGGYYFDVDIDVIKPFYHVRSATDKEVTFSTVIDLKESAFFQAFLAATPRHPIIKTALKVIQAYYDSPYRTTKGIGTPMGPLTLAAAYRLVVGEPGNAALGSGPMTKEQKIKDQIEKSEKNTGLLIPLLGRRPEEEKIAYAKFMDKVMELKANLTEEGTCLVIPNISIIEHIVSLSNMLPALEQWYIYNSTVLLQESHLKDHMYKSTPRKKGNMYCNMIVHDPKAVVPYFYSRIAGSQNCQPSLCGSGHIGGGKCANPGDCCSPTGWCGTSPAHCRRSRIQTKPVAGDGFCGDGRIGNGTCPFADLCCSPSGWCGKSEQHCRNYCGNGRVGNGKCPTNEPGMCCSSSGWCGTSQAHCSKPPIDYCGNGHVGKGICEDSSLCCSASGWCGKSSAHCSTATQPLNLLVDFDLSIPCGNGKIGNGRCTDSSLCCSPSGWCGKTAAHCKRTACGNGFIGNGKCSSPDMCCSPSGWCGKTAAHCSKKKLRIKKK